VKYIIPVLALVGLGFLIMSGVLTSIIDTVIRIVQAIQGAT
jgi:hypothetical protein